MKLTAYGRREWGASGAAAALIAGLALWLQHPGGALAAALVWAYIAFFFRDPARALPEGAGLFTAPADGLVDDVTLLSEGEACTLMGCEKVVRIGIFLSVFDVHLNRVPCALRVTAEAHRPGGYLDARHPDCQRLNEAHTIVGIAEPSMGGRPVMVRQIAGLIARRIVCEAKPGMLLQRGDRYGMIKFGSRTELYLPAVPEIEIAAKPGTRATGGITVLARLKK
jgi:phosphatidylserine decarboxylase